MFANRSNSDDDFGEFDAPFRHEPKHTRVKDFQRWLSEAKGDEHCVASPKENEDKTTQKEKLIMPPMNVLDEELIDDVSENSKDESKELEFENFPEQQPPFDYESMGRFLKELDEVVQEDTKRNFDLQGKWAKIDGLYNEEAKEATEKTVSLFKEDIGKSSEMSVDDHFLELSPDEEKSKEQEVEVPASSNVKIEYVYHRRWEPRKSIVRRVNVQFERWSLERYKENWRWKMRTDTLRTRMIPVISGFLKEREQHDSFTKNLQFMDKVCESIAKFK